MKTDWQECLRPEPDDGQAKLCVSLNARGDIAINAAAWEKLGRPWFVVLLFDPERRMIGVKPAKPGTQNAFPVRHRRGSRARVVRARRLIKQFGIEITQTLRFREPHLAGGIWILDLGSAF